jgi:hypothetical protein
MHSRGEPCRPFNPQLGQSESMSSSTLRERSKLGIAFYLIKRRRGFSLPRPFNALVEWRLEVDQMRSGGLLRSGRFAILQQII